MWSMKASMQASFVLASLCGAAVANTELATGYGASAKEAYEEGRDMAITKVVMNYAASREPGLKRDFVAKCVIERLKLALVRRKHVLIRGKSPDSYYRVKNRFYRKVEVTVPDGMLSDVWAKAEKGYNAQGVRTVMIYSFQEEIEDSARKVTTHHVGGGSETRWERSGTGAGEESVSDDGHTLRVGGESSAKGRRDHEWGSKYSTQSGPAIESQDASWAQAGLEASIKENGITVVVRSPVEALQAASIDRAKRDDATTLSMLREMASQAGAQIYIVGSARAMGPQSIELRGIHEVAWDTHATYRAYWTSNGQLVSTHSDQEARPGAQERSGALQSLQAAGESLGKKFVADFFQELSRHSFEPPASAATVVLHDASLSDAIRIKRAIVSSTCEDGCVSDITGASRVYQFSVVSERSTEDLASDILGIKLDTCTLDIDAMKTTYLEVKVRHLVAG